MDGGPPFIEVHRVEEKPQTGDRGKRDEKKDGGDYFLCSFIVQKRNGTAAFLPRHSVLSVIGAALELESFSSSQREARHFLGQGQSQPLGLHIDDRRDATTQLLSPAFPVAVVPLATAVLRHMECLLGLAIEEVNKANTGPFKAALSHSSYLPEMHFRALSLPRASIQSYVIFAN